MGARLLRKDQPEEQVSNAERPGFSGLGRLLAISTIGSVLAMGVSVLRGKVTAVVLGPHGVGTLAEIGQAITLALVPISFATGPALVTAVARMKENRGVERARSAIYTALLIVVFGGGVAATLGALAGASLVDNGDQGQGQLLWFGLVALGSWIAGPFSVLTTALSAGGHVRQATTLTLVQSLVTGLAVVACTLIWGLEGQLWAALSAAVLVFPFAWRLFRTTLPGLSDLKNQEISWSFVRESIVVGGSNLVAAGALQLVWSLIRSLTHDWGGTEANGQLQAMRSVGVAYFGLVLQGLGSVVFPAYARTTGTRELQELVDQALSLAFRFVPPLILVAIAAKRFAMHGLYSDQFGTATEAVGYAMASDFAKAVTWILGGPLLYHGRIRAFVLAEILGSGAIAVAAYAFVPIYGVTGAAIAHVVGYLIAVLIYAFILRSSLSVFAGYSRLLGTWFVTVALTGVVTWSTGTGLRELIIGVVGGVWATFAFAPTLRDHVLPRVRRLLNRSSSK